MDAVWHLVGGVPVLGNKTDQNANAVADENGSGGRYDVFSIPTPSAGEQPFSFPYISTTLPLTIPGPHMTGSSVPNGSNGVVLAGVATAVDVSFDRLMNTNP